MSKIFYTTVDNLTQKRTIRPIYAQHQATPYAGYLDPNWSRATDIYPGMVMALNGQEQFTLFTGTGSGATAQQMFGLAALFVAPKLGIDEVRFNGTNLFTVWIGQDDATFEVLAPAFDPNANWAYPTNGQRVMLTSTTAANAAGPGLLTPLNPGGGTTITTETGVYTGNGGAGAAIAELIAVPSTTKIYIRMNRLNNGTIAA